MIAERNSRFDPTSYPGFDLEYWLWYNRQKTWKIRDGIYLSGRGWLPQDRWRNAEQIKFVRCFRETWPQIPLGARRQMFKHWRSAEPNTHLIFAPQIYVQAWPGRSPGQCAICAESGFQLQFFPNAIVWFERQQVRELIAHELAHVLQFSRSPDGITTDTSIPREQDPVEIEADEIMESWGFSSKTIDLVPEVPESWKSKRWLIPNANKIFYVPPSLRTGTAARRLSQPGVMLCNE